MPALMGDVAREHLASRAGAGRRVGLRHGGDGFGGRHSAELQREGRDGPEAPEIGLAHGIEEGGGHVDAQGCQAGRPTSAALRGDAGDAERAGSRMPSQVQ